MNRRTLLLAIVLVGAVLRLGPAVRDLDMVDRLFVPDDTYYTLTISRALAQGDGPTVDGETLTSGFQPLLAFMTVPVFRATDDPDTPLRAVILFGALADLIAVVLLARLARRAAGEEAGLLAAALWAVSPLAIANALGGLETSIALCLQLALVDAWCIARERRTPSTYVRAGMLAGLALLARVDSAFLVAGLGMLELWNGDRRRVILAVVAAVVVVAPWWGYSFAVFGSPVPESGAAVRDIVAQHREIYLRTHMPVAWAAGTLIGAPVLDVGGVRQCLYDHPPAAWFAYVTFVGFVAYATWRWLRRSPAAPIAVFAVHGLVIVGFYTFVVSALWFFRRYLAPAEASISLVIAIAVAQLWQGGRTRKVVAASITGGLVLIGLLGSARLSVIAPTVTPDTGLHGAKGYREAARDVLALLPPDAVVGAFQSGALAYYAPATMRVLNLDGVVDRRAARAGRERRLAEYARERGMTHLADWKFNIDNFVRLSRASAGAASVAVRTVGAARSQGLEDKFIVLAVEWR